MFMLFCFWLWSLRGVFGGNTMLEGESVTLNPDLTETQRNNQIEWRFGPNNILIAKLKDSKITVQDHYAGGRFRDRLKLNQTGSLSIMNTRTSDSGLYTVTRSSTRLKSFNLMVYAHLPIPLVSRDCSVLRHQSCSVVCSVVNVSHVTLSWLKGNSLLSSISVSDLSISLSLPLEVEDQDTNNYSCVLNNSITHQTTHLDISGVCQTCQGLSSLNTVLISAAGFLLIITAVVIFCIYRKTIQQETVQSSEEITYADPTFYKKKAQKSKICEKEDVVYAGIAVRH